MLSDPELRSGVVKLFNREADDPKWQEEAELQCSQVARQRSDIHTAIRKAALSDSDDAGNAIKALGKCVYVSDIQLLESRASVLRKESSTRVTRKESMTNRHFYR